MATEGFPKGKSTFLSHASPPFRIGIAVRENEREALLQSPLPVRIKSELSSAKKYPEGYPLRLAISQPPDMSALRIVLELLENSR